MSLVREPGATLQVIDNTFEPGRAVRTWTPIAFGETVLTVLPANVVPDGSWVVIEEGRSLAPETWATHRVKPDTELICYPRMNGAVGRMIVGGVLVAVAAVGGFFFPEFAPFWWGVGLMGVGLIAGGGVELLMGPPKPAMVPNGNGDQAGSPTYGFGGIQVSR